MKMRMIQWILRWKKWIKCTKAAGLIIEVVVIFLFLIYSCLFAAIINLDQNVAINEPNVP